MHRGSHLNNPPARTFLKFVSFTDLPLFFFFCLLLYVAIYLNQLHDLVVLNKYVTFRKNVCTFNGTVYMTREPAELVPNKRTQSQLHTHRNVLACIIVLLLKLIRIVFYTLSHIAYTYICSKCFSLPRSKLLITASHTSIFYFVMLCAYYWFNSYLKL